MAMQGKDWVRFHHLLEPTIGEEGAATLVEVLSSVPWGDIATKSDFADLRGEFADLRVEFAGLTGEFAGLRGDFADLRVEFAALSVGLRDDFADLRNDFADLRNDFASQKSEIIRWVAGIAVTGMAASMGIAAAVASVIAR
jgi:hypothetical protein